MPTSFHVLLWSQPNLIQRSGAPGKRRHLHAMYRDQSINISIGLKVICVGVVPELGACTHWSCDELRAGALSPMGDHSKL